MDVLQQAIDMIDGCEAAFPGETLAQYKIYAAANAQEAIDSFTMKGVTQKVEFFTAVKAAIENYEN